MADKYVTSIEFNSDGEEFVIRDPNVPNWARASTPPTGDGSSQLAGKKIMLAGDSFISGKNNGGSFENFISRDFPDRGEVGSIAASGATLYLYSPEISTYPVIINKLISFKDSGDPVPDYLILDGGGNDFAYGVQIGEVDQNHYLTDSELTSELTSLLSTERIPYIDTDLTVVKGLDILFAWLTFNMPSTKVLYLSFAKSDFQEFSPITISFAEQRRLISAMGAECAKYGITFVNLFDNDKSALIKGMYVDGLHPKEAGYAEMWPVVRAAMLSETSSAVVQNDIGSMGDFESTRNKITEVTEQNRNSTTFYPSMKVLSDAVDYVTSLIPQDGGSSGSANVTVDDTLSIGGAAADAAVTGGAINELKEDLETVDSRLSESMTEIRDDAKDVLSTEKTQSLTWVAGRYNANGEAKDGSSTYYVKSALIPCANIKRVKLDGLYKADTVSTITFFKHQSRNVIQANPQPTSNIFDVPHEADFYAITSTVNLKDATVVTNYSKSAINVEIDNVNADYIDSFLTDEYLTTLHRVEELSSLGSSFAFATDLHFSSEGSGYNEEKLRNPIKRMFKVWAKLSRKLPITVNVCGGDYEQLPPDTEGQTKQMGIDCVTDVNDWLSSVNGRKISISGNHERNFSGNNTGYGLSDLEIYGLISLKYTINDIKKANYKVFYLIDDTSSLFYVFVNHGYQTINTQVIQGLNTALARNTSKYPIVIFAHHAMDDSGNVYQGAKDTIDLIINANHSIVAYIGGHCHADWHAKYNDVLVVTCLQSGFLTSKRSENGITYEHVFEDYNESALSIFTIDQNNRKLYCTRFGLGNDREFDY